MDGEIFTVGEKTTIRAAEIAHPGGCLGFRIENEGNVFTYCTDSSHKDGMLSKAVLELAAGADLLVHDAQYTMDQREKYRDYGHSSWFEAAMVAREANVGCLALFHYDPSSSDDDMENILEQACQVFPHTILSREGLTIDLPLAGESE